MRIYLDSCCYNRINDNRSLIRNYLERETIMLIIQLAEEGRFDIIGSDVLDYELSRIQDIEFKERVLLAKSVCKETIPYNKIIRSRAQQIQSISSIKSFDSLHIASVEHENIDVFLTVDDKFLKAANRIAEQIAIRVMNPIEWLMEVQV